MMRYGDKTEILWYNLPKQSAWELYVFDGLYGTNSFWDKSISNISVEINPSSPLIGVTQKQFERISDLYTYNRDPSTVFCTDMMCFSMGDCNTYDTKDFQF